MTRLTILLVEGEAGSEVLFSRFDRALQPQSLSTNRRPSEVFAAHSSNSLGLVSCPAGSAPVVTKK